MKYRPKPPTVEARQLTPDQLADVASWSGGTITTTDDGTTLVVLSLDDAGTTQAAELWWWVTMDAAGAVSAYPPEVFAEAWEPAP